jgi:hypothetical protein
VADVLAHLGEHRATRLPVRAAEAVR